MGHGGAGGVVGQTLAMLQGQGRLSDNGRVLIRRLVPARFHSFYAPSVHGDV
jgi:hypothetical protein